MNEFDFIFLEKKENTILILMKTSESPLDYINEMEVALENISFFGNVVIDELLHSGNNDERFIAGYFNGRKFDGEQFKYEVVSKKSHLREPACDFLRRDRELLRLTGLTLKQQKLIEQGCII